MKMYNEVNIKLIKTHVTVTSEAQTPAISRRSKWGSLTPVEMIEVGRKVAFREHHIILCENIVKELLSMLLFPFHTL